MLAMLRAMCRLLTILMVFLMTTMLVVMSSLVVTRYFFSYSPSWTEEVTRYAMIWLVMLGAGVLTLFDDHITLTLVVDKLKGRKRQLQRLLAHAFVLAVALLTAWKGIEFASGLKSVVAPALQVSMLLPSIVVPVGAAIIAFCAALRVAIEIALLLGMTPPALPAQNEFMDNSFKPVDDEVTAGAGAHHGARQ